MNVVQKAIQERLFCAEAFEPYHSAKDRQYPYYRISVRNYTIFYVVIDDVMEVRRIVYSRRDLRKQIESMKRAGNVFLDALKKSAAGGGAGA